MITPEERQAAKAWAQDVIECGGYRFHACRHDSRLVSVSDCNGAWRAYYRPADDRTVFVLEGFGYGNPPPEIRIIALVMQKVEEWFL